jgi:hypothetical protein
MSIQAVAWALDQDIPNAGLKLVLIALCNHADKSTGELFLRHSTVEKEASMSRSSVQRHVKTLADMGIIEIGSTFDASGRQAANSYRIVFTEGEQKQVAASRTAREGCQSDTLPIDGEAVGGTEPEGVTLTTRGSTGGAGEGVNGDTPNTNHPSEPSSPLTPLTGGVDGLLEKMISIWPQEHLGKRDVAERELQALPDAKRQRAADCIKVFLLHCRLRREKIPRLSVYLSAQMFEIVYGAPDLDGAGYYRIHSERAEWGPWLEYVRRKHGEAKAEKCLAEKMILVKTRWPPDLSLANGVTNLATSGTGMATASADRA